MPHQPIRFSDLIGQPLAVSLLDSSLKRQQSATAYLFEGVAGSGKETAARLFAMQLLGCKRLETLDYHPDFILTTAETGEQIRVQQIRDLLRQLATYPLVSQRRVVLVRAAQRLNEAAGNALLKTLEDSRFTTFVLLCDQPLRLDTIRSRGQVIPFYPLELGALQTVLSQVAPALLDYPELLQCAEGSPGAALEGWKQAAQCAGIKQTLYALPTEIEGQFELSQAVSSLPEDTQKWLLTFIGWSGWQQHGVLEAVDQARRQLKQHCHALSVWEHLFKQLASTAVTLRLNAPPWLEADATVMEPAPEAECAPTAVVAPPATKPSPPQIQQPSLFSYRPQ